ncbi:MAG: hypothetical protein LBI75_10175 [Brucellaceae bacterium]|nr:hypothetical protein [Brucellaceae bacterium]
MTEFQTGIHQIYSLRITTVIRRYATIDANSLSTLPEQPANFSLRPWLQKKIQYFYTTVPMGTVQRKYSCYSYPVLTGQICFWEQLQTIRQNLLPAAACILPIISAHSGILPLSSGRIPAGRMPECGGYKEQA